MIDFVWSIAYITIITVVQMDKNKGLFGLAHFHLTFTAE